MGMVNPWQPLPFPWLSSFSRYSPAVTRWRNTSSPVALLNTATVQSMGELGRSLLYAQPVIAESETFSSRPLGTAANAVVADAASRLKVRIAPVIIVLSFMSVPPDCSCNKWNRNLKLIT